MALINAKMSAVFQLSSRIFGRRAEFEIKESPHANCVNDITTGMGVISGITTNYQGLHFAKNEDDQVCIVLELGVTGVLNNLNLILSAELWLIIQASGNITSFDINFEYYQSVISSPVPIPDEVRTEIENEIRNRIEPLIVGLQFPINIGIILAQTMSIVGNPELTIVGGSNQNSPTLAIGLEILDSTLGPDNTIDRNHFRNSYHINLITSNDDWVFKIDSTLMESKIREEFDNTNISQYIDIWKRTDYREAYWSGNGRNWDYKGWREYINQHYTEHPIWLACRGVIDLVVPYPSFGWENFHPTVEIKYEHIDVGIYWFAYADFRIINQRIVFDPYIFEIGLRNDLSYVLPEISMDLDPIDIGPASFGNDFIMTRTHFTTDDFSIYGIDTNEGLPGYPMIQVPLELGVNYSLKPVEISGRASICMGFYNVGQLDAAGSVISNFEICNIGTGTAPLWICSLDLDDPDAVFTLSSNFTFPQRIGPGECRSITVLLTVTDDDHSIHNGSILIRSNDFNQPISIISISGKKDPQASGELAYCLEIPGVYRMNEKLLRLLEFFNQHFEERVQEVDFGLPPIDPDPDPPCPKCGYYLDFIFAGLPPSVTIDIYDESNKLIERSQFINDLHVFSIPFSHLNKVTFSITPIDMRSNIFMKVEAYSLKRLSYYNTELDILQLSTNREFVYLLHKTGIEVINITVPEKPSKITDINIMNCKGMGISDDYLYAKTTSGVTIYDISDPYTPQEIHEIKSLDSKLLIGRNRILISDDKKIREYLIQQGKRPQLISEFKIEDKIVSMVGLQRDTMFISDKEIFKARTTNIKQAIMRKVPVTKEDLDNIISRHKGEKVIHFPHKFILQDDYLLNLHENKRRFDILQRNSITLDFDEKIREQIKSIR